MAYDYSGTGVYSGRPNFDLFLYVRRDQTDYANNRSSYCWELRARNLQGGSATWNGNQGVWNVSVANQGFSGTHSLDFRGGQAFITLATGCTGWVQHAADGTLAIQVAANHTLGQFGTGGFGAQWFYTDRIPKVPGPVQGLNVTGVTPTSVSLAWTGPSDWNGATPWGYSVQWATNSAFTQNVGYFDTGTLNTSVNILNLAPGTRYYMRVRARNSATYNNDGWGAWSNAVTADTTASVAPGLTVTPSLSGQSAKLTFSPPSGGAGVVSYRIERLIDGTSGPLWTATVTTSTTTVSNLAPGTVYRWRVRANYSSSSGPYSNWQTIQQPRPNTSAGDYFDGSTTDTADNDYAWTGTANASTSVATGVRPTGWVASATAGAGIVQRVTGGRTGMYAARLIVTADATDIRIGMTDSAAGRSDVAENGTYWGSGYVQSSTAREVRAFITWLNSAGTKIGEDGGTTVVVPANEWTRVNVSATAPINAAHAQVQISGGNLIAGDSFQVDNLMLTLSTLLPYFDGATEDTTEYDYSWTGTANESVSQRVTRPAETVNPLIDPDCAVVPLPPRPPAVPDTCIIETGQWRRYWARIAEGEVSDWLTMVPTITLNSGPYAARQVRIRIFPNPNNRQPEELSPEGYCSEQIVSYIPANTTMVLDGVSQSAWATVGDLDPMTADHLLYGTGGVPPTWPELSCGMAHMVAFDVPLDAPEGSLSPTIDLTTRTG